MATTARATAARHDLMPSRTWDKKVHSVRAGVQKLCAACPKATCSAANAWAMSSAVSTSANGRPSAWQKGARTFSKGEAPGGLVEKDMEAFLVKSRNALPRKASRRYPREGRPP